MAPIDDRSVRDCGLRRTVQRGAVQHVDRQRIAVDSRVRGRQVETGRGLGHEREAAQFERTFCALVVDGELDCGGVHIPEGHVSRRVGDLPDNERGVVNGDAGGIQFLAGKCVALTGEDPATQACGTADLHGGSQCQTRCPLEGQSVGGADSRREGHPLRILDGNVLESRGAGAQAGIGEVDSLGL